MQSGPTPLNDLPTEPLGPHKPRPDEAKPTPEQWRKSKDHTGFYEKAGKLSTGNPDVPETIGA